MSDALLLFGTDEPASEGRRLAAGRLTATLQDGNLRHLRFGGIEIIRAISCVVRDHEWGTVAPQIEELRVEESGTEFAVSYRATCRIGAQVVRYDATITGSERRLDFAMHAVAETDFLTARLGFVVLHPISGVAGEPVEILHVDGSVERARFPDLIEAYQPFQDLRAMTHAPAPGLAVTCRMEGDTFETEDQRNWTDASYKTYVRPIGLPWPYRLEAGTALEQRVTLEIVGDVTDAAVTETHAALRLGEGAGCLPRIGLHLEPGSTISAQVLDHVRALAPAFLLARHDGRTRDVGALRHAGETAAAVGAALHLEAVLPGRDLDAEARSLASDIAEAGVAVDTVFAFPAADLKGTLPGSAWPECPPLQEVYRAVRAALPDARLGGGTPNFFTELNRKRPPVDLLDVVTFSTSAIVHAADDITVMENLEALPAIFRSATVIAAGKPICLGPSHIACRDNPYGEAAAANPDRVRRAMTADDPRQRGQFAAAWTVGFLARCVGSGVREATLGSPIGRFGALHEEVDGVTSATRPVYDVLRAAARAREAEAVTVHTTQPGNVAAIAWHEDGAVRLLAANLTRDILDVAIEGGGSAVPLALAPFETREIVLSAS